MVALVIARPTDTWDKIATWLTGFGWEVQRINSLVAGRKTLDQDPHIDVILLDGVSADDSGIKFLSTLASDNRLAAIPVLVAVSSIDEDLVRRYMSAGVNDIIVMPPNKDTFEAKIRQIERTGKPCILVVDDEPDIRELLAEFLILQRYRPLMAGSAEEGLETMEGTPVDLVITDILMPGMSGLDLMATIKLTKPEIPVILITGFGGVYTPQYCIAVGADGYFAKPFHNMELIYTLRRILSRRSPALVTNPPI